MTDGFDAPLTAGDFARFFTAVNGHPPFPWQERLAAQVIATGTWPDLAVPTGAGKTAALDVALFHLACDADKGADRRAAIRVVFVVDRRLVVDDAYDRATRLAQALDWALAAPAEASDLAAKTPENAEAIVRVRAEPIVATVARRLRHLAGDDAPPLVARRLRGGLPREGDWALSPCQPTLVSATIDQIGSRLLFRGYGVSDRMKPVHAGLIGADCLILLDEAHLARPFRQTLGQVSEVYQGAAWRAADSAARPLAVATLTATPEPDATDRKPFELNDEDHTNPVLARRLGAAKPVRLLLAATPRGADDASDDDSDEAETDAKREAAEAARVVALCDATDAALAVLKAADPAPPALAVVVNRVARARAVFDQLRARHGDAADTVLMIGPSRPHDRDALIARLASARTGTDRSRPLPLVVVATQTIEAGADLDFDALVSDLAPLDALVQRFGRLNRAGRAVAASGAIIAVKADLAARADDPVYGTSLRPTWTWLQGVAADPRAPSVDFGIDAFKALREATPPPDATRPPPTEAPILMPAHVDLLAQTAPIPAPDPDVALWLHGTERRPAGITIVWRADIAAPAAGAELSDEDARARRLLLLLPPRVREAVELPIGAVRRWLDGAAPGLVADVTTIEDETDETPTRQARRVFRWRGDDDLSRWIQPRELRPGDSIVVPASYGGLDAFGWNPGYAEEVVDIAEAAALAVGAPAPVRLHAALLAPATPAPSGETAEGATARHQADAERRADIEAEIKSLVREARSTRWHDLGASIIDWAAKKPVAERLNALDKTGVAEVITDLYRQADGLPTGLILVPSRRRPARDTAATEDDVAGSLPGYAQELGPHLAAVAAMAHRFASACGLPEEVVSDLELAAKWHDLGKADPRFQRMLAGADPLGGAPDTLLAKSAARLPRGGGDPGLPRNWRHEALSVRLALAHADLGKANDPDLVLWLIGTHHGYGRPFFPHADDLDGTARDLPHPDGPSITLPAAPGPQSLAFDRDGADWPTLFRRLSARWGVWGLASLEAILRLADHRASAAAEEGEKS